MVLALALELAACQGRDASPGGRASPVAGPRPCGKDTDRKGARVCVAGACADPGAIGAGQGVVAPGARALASWSSQGRVLSPATAPTGMPVVASALEASLVEVLQPDPVEPEQRRGDTGAAIQGYVRAGLVDEKPDARADYSDYRLLKRPTTLLGHPLIVIDEEYPKGDLGCCVDPGIAVTLQAGATDPGLVAFASANRCTLNVATERDFADVGLTIPRGRYATLSCKTRVLFETAPRG